MSRYHFICDSRVEDNGNLGISFYGPSPDDGFWEFVSRKSKYVRNISIR